MHFCGSSSWNFMFIKAVFQICNDFTPQNTAATTNTNSRNHSHLWFRKWFTLRNINASEQSCMKQPAAELVEAMFSKKLLPVAMYSNITLDDTVFSILSFIINRLLCPSSFLCTGNKSRSWKEALSRQYSRSWKDGNVEMLR